MAGDDDKNPAAGEKPVVPAAGAKASRKYTWPGKTPRNPAIANIYGSVRIKPWAMTDAEIDTLLLSRPDLARLWTVTKS